MIQNFVDKMVEKFNKFFDKDTSKREINPKRDWVLVISMFFLFSLLLIFFYYFIFSKDLLHVSDLGVPGEVLPPELSIEKITKDNLKKMIIFWDGKQKKFDEYLLTKPDFDSLQ